MTLHPVLEALTARIRSRSLPTRSAYLRQIAAAGQRDRGADRLGCANVAHAFAALPANDKLKVVAEKAPNIGIVTAYNDMLSAHAPFAQYPALIKDEARLHRATAQVAGGVPAMCDGVTQGTPGMELSLFSRDVIAQATAIALSHDVFDAALMLGVCDKIVPGLLIGALHFGHLPMVFVPAGPMTSGLSNSAKAKVRERAAQGLADRAELLESESAAYHGQGTCTFYGTANSNQMLLEAMGLHVPGTAFINPGEGLREQLTREAVRTVLGSLDRPIGRIVDERCIVNAMAALLATGGSTNHLIHWVAVARSAGIVIDWDDFATLSAVVPLLAKVYPNGSADVNQFQAAGGPGYVIRELLDAGLMHEDVLTVRSGIREYTRKPVAAEAGLAWEDIGESADASVVCPAAAPFSPTGGLKLLTGNLGRSVIKTSSVPDDRHIIEAPARVFDSQEALLAAFKAGELERLCQDTSQPGAAGGVVCVVRWQGPQANGMPELHKLTPPLAVLQGKGYQVALVTDGRMSGASGKVPAAIHVSPEALAGGPLARVRDGDVLRVDAVAGTLDALVDAAEWAARSSATLPTGQTLANGLGMGRELFASLRRNAQSAEEGACSWLLNLAADLTPLQVMQDAPVIPVIVLHDLAHAVPLARALVAGGIRMLEVTLRTPVALQCIEAIANEVPEAVAGAGTVRSAADAQAAALAGAKFAVSPGYTATVGRACHDLGLPLLPGVATGSEIMAAQEGGYTQLKFFPALQAGGIAMLKAFAGPFGDVRFCPTGGVTPQNAADFLALPNVACVGGSWLVPADALAQGDWARISALAREAAAFKR